MTRWREDPTRDCWGTYVFPSRCRPRHCVVGGVSTEWRRTRWYEATFLEDRVEIVRRDGTITTTLEVTVSSERRCGGTCVTITNSGRAARDIDLDVIRLGRPRL